MELEIFIVNTKHKKSIKVHLAPLNLCTDNAAMLGAAALFRIKFKDHLSSLKLGVAGRLSIEQANTLYEENPPF